MPAIKHPTSLFIHLFPTPFLCHHQLTPLVRTALLRQRQVQHLPPFAYLDQVRLQGLLRRVRDDRLRVPRPHLLPLASILSTISLVCRRLRPHLLPRMDCSRGIRIPALVAGEPSPHEQANVQHAAHHPRGRPPRRSVLRAGSEPPWAALRRHGHHVSGHRHLHYADLRQRD